VSFHGGWAAASGASAWDAAAGSPVNSTELVLLGGLALLALAVLVAYLVTGRSGPDEEPADQQTFYADPAAAAGPPPGSLAATAIAATGSTGTTGAQPSALPPLARRRPAPPSEAFSVVHPVSGPRHRADDRQQLPTLSNKSTVGGRIFGPTGGPVIGAVLTATDSYGGSAGSGRSAADGQYRLHLPTGGTFLLVCTAEGHQSAAVMVTVATSTLARDIVLGNAGGIDGWIRYQHGASAAGATVSLTDLRGEVVASTVAGADGGYRLRGLNAGEYTLVAGAPGAQPAARAVQVPAHGTGQVDLVLQSNGALRGTVRSARDGRQVPDASVSLVNVHGDLVAASSTGADGEYVFGEVPPGGYTLIAAGYPPVSTRILLTGERTEVCDVLLGVRAGADPFSQAAR
jgi:hypothetical protein